MSVEQLNNNSTSILLQLSLINQNRQHRQSIYKQCLMTYRNHLNLQTQQIINSHKSFKNRSQKTKQSFQNIYNSIYQGADRILRSIRRTCQSKKTFWKETIKEFSNSNDLELKKDMYSLKRDAQDKWDDAVDARKQMKYVQFDKVFSRRNKKEGLIEFQQGNKVLQEKTVLGTKTSAQWKPLERTYIHSQNKENYSENNQSAYRRAREGESLIDTFIKK